MWQDLAILGTQLGTSYLSSRRKKRAARRAYRRLLDATRKSISEYQRYGNQAQDIYRDQTDRLLPYLQPGAEANRMLGALYGLGGTPGLSTKQAADRAISTIKGSPGYAFARREGERGIQSALASTGLGSSGAALRGLTQYNQDYADTRYNQYIGGLDRLANRGLHGVGQQHGANALYQQALADVTRGRSQAHLLAGGAGAAASIAQGRAGAQAYEDVGAALGKYFGSTTPVTPAAGTTGAGAGGGGGATGAGGGGFWPAFGDTFKGLLPSFGGGP